MAKTARGHRWTGWSARTPSLVRPFPVLRCEQLESRLAPATYTWSGNGADAKWSTPANWVGNVAPTGNPANVEDLVFPAGAARKANQNDLPANRVFNSISFADGGYTLTGNAITLGLPGTPGSGFLVVNAGAQNDTVAFNVLLGASGGIDQTFTVNAGADLTVSGKLSGTTGSTLTKDGPGTLTLTNDNSGFTGSIKLNNNSGALVVAHALALGTTSSPTIVGTGSSLRVAAGTGTIAEPLILNGLGVANDGALLNLGGTNTWSGAITLDSNTAVGAAAGTLNVRGQIGDTASGWSLFKEGPGEVQLNSPTGNTYRGQTVVDNGVLTVGHPLALGAAGTAANGTVVNQTLTGAGQLRLADPTGAGFTVVNEFLTLNGAGPAGLANPGSLTDTKGDNTWAGPVVLGSPSPNGSDVTVGAAAGTNLTISGVVSSPNGSYQLVKRDAGRLILNNANTYTGATAVQEGVLNVRDSNALGGTAGGTTVADGAALELEVEAANPNTPRFDAQGRDLWDDSVTHDPHRLWVSEPLNIAGRGVNNTGALRSVSGLNRYLAGVLLANTAFGNTADAIGVDPDQRPGHPTPDASYFVSDYSLTVVGNISGSKFNDFVKRGTGHLILPNANSYTGRTRIEQGWVTIQNNRSLGADNSPITSQTVQPATYVSAGAALHVRPLVPGAPLTIPENLNIAGVGIDHPYALLGRKGALMNLDGVNTWTGDIGLIGSAGVGVEEVVPGSPSGSELTVTGSTLDGRNSYTFTANGGAPEQSFLIDLGVTSGVIRVDYDFFSIPDDLRVYYPPRGPGQVLIFDTGVVNGAKVVNIPFGPGTGTTVELVMNEGGGQPGTAWVLNDVSIQLAGGLVKLGSKRLNLQGDGTYSGATEVREGTLRAQNDTALGQSSTGTATTQQTYNQTATTVDAGAVLELTRSVAGLNGGIAAGIQVWNEQLVLNAAGQQVAVAGAGGTFTLTYPGGGTTGPLPITATAADVQAALAAVVPGAVGPVSVTRSGNVFTVVFGTARTPNVPLLTATPSGGAEVTVSGGNAPLVNLADDNAWRGPVTLAAGSRVSVAADSRLSLLGPIDDAADPAPAGSDLVKRGAGELILGGSNSFRGTTAIDEGILTAVNSKAFGATTGGTVVADGAQLQLQGSLTIAGEPLVLQGAGPGSLPNFPARWFNAGAAPTNTGLSPQTLPTSGRITGVAVDPTDPDVIYVATAGGGAWKTKNGGFTWLPLFDSTADAAAVMYGGAIAVAPSNPNVVYFATGESNGAPNGFPITGPQDNYAGSGVYKSTDAGATWTLLTGPGGANPLFGQAVTKLIVDPADANRIYVASGTTNVLNGLTTAVPGVYRFDAGGWFDLTAAVSTNRNSVNGQAPYDAPTNGNGPPKTPGPDDDYRIVFPQANATWSDILLLGGTLYAALGESNQPNFVVTGSGPPTVVSQAVRNGVYWTTNPTSNTPAWTLGGGNVDARSGGFPVGDPVNGPPRNGYIKLAGSGTTIYASVVNPANGQLLDIQKSTDGGRNWSATGAVPPAPFGNTNPALGRYDHTLLAQDAATVFLGGSDNVFVTGDGGTTWGLLTPDATGAAPARQFHGLALDGRGRLTTASDGGVWRWDGTNWFDLNGNLAVTELNSADPHPTDLGLAYAGAADNGVQRFGNNLAWQRVDDANGSNGGVVRFDPKNPQVAYAARDGVLRKTTNGGATWATLRTVTTSANYFPLVVDTVNTARILVGGPSLVESADGGASFVNLNAGVGLTAIGAATFQGQFVADPSFPLVADKLSNTYDPDTVYVTDGTTLRVTKNHGVSWVTRNVPGLGTGVLTDIAVDPSNRDTVYVTVSRPGLVAGGRVYRTTDAGRTWTDITGTGATALPAIPTWRVIVDPRSGTVYVGNDNGVWALPDAATTATFTWSRVGAGMPRVQVHDLVLNQTLNTLTAGTYGRSMYQLFLPDYQPNSGAVREVSGSSVWTGPVTLAGDTTIGAAGTQNIQNGIAAASLNIIGTISDLVPGADATLVKIGRGTVTLSGTNTYGGQTQVREGVLQVNNPRALGAPTPGGNTVVSPGAALELRSDLELEPVTANGNGIPFNGHFTGALRNVSNINTYTGTLTFGTDTTIGVDSGTALTIGSKPGVLVGTGSMTDAGNGFSFDKELTGTLVLAGADTFGGLARVVQGALQVQNPLALGDTAKGTRVLDGAQLQLARNAVTLAPTTVTGEPLFLSGTGIFKTGALLNVRGDSDPAGTNDNTWQGPITLDIAPNFFPATNPGSQVAFGVSDARDTLTVDGVIGQDSTQASFGLIKVGPGRLALTRANAYTGVTNVNAGAVRVLDSGALGAVSSGEVQTINVIGTTDNFGNPLLYRLSFNGQTTGDLAATASAAAVQSALEGLSTVGNGNVLVSETPTLNGKVLTVTFRNALATTNLPITATNVSPGLAININTAQPGGAGTIVAAGAALELDGTSGPLNVGEVLALNGDGINAAGALDNLAADNTYSGPITLVTDTSIGAAAGTTLTVTGSVQDPVPAPVPSARLRKAGPGTVVFTAANPYGGKTAVDEGVLRIQDAGALGVVRPEVQQVQVIGTNGTFTLTFNGRTTAPLAFNATAAEVQAALAALPPTYGGVTGSVSVIAVAGGGGTLFTVTFTGGLANTNVPQMTAAVTGGTTAIVTTIQDGSEGTAVALGATLQVAGGITMTDEVVVINGVGFNGQGALNNFSGSNTWAIPLVLGSDASVGTTTAADLLTFTAPITDNGNAFNLDLVGPGAVKYAAAVDNQYTGTTTVRQGALLLSQPAGLAILGPLVVGDGQPGAAAAIETLDDQIADAAPVAVNADGTFDLAGQSDEIGTLTITDGAALTGPGGTLTTGDVTMTGGLVGIVNGGRVVLTGDVSATSSAAAPALIGGPGTLDLNGADRTFAVADGPQVVDLAVTAPVSAVGSERVVKTGPGRLVFGVASSAVTVSDQAGDVQVDAGAAVGPVELVGGSLSGNGTVASIGGPTPGSQAVGVVGPGANGTPNPVGVLHTGPVTWGPATTFSVDLSHTTVGDPVPGTDNDQLQVTGDIFLGGATLTGTFTAGVQLGDRFTVITTTGGTVHGRFAEPFGPNVVFIQGHKFTVDYSDPTAVVLAKVKADATVAVSSSANPSTFGQPVLFTATITPEPGAGPVPTTDTVTFTLDGVTYPAVPVNANGQAVFDPQAATGGPLAGGTHTLSAVFNGDAVDFNPAAGALAPDQLVEVPVIDPLAAAPPIISPNNSPGIQDFFTVSTNVREERSPATWAVTVRDGNGAVVRTYTGNAVIAGNSFPIVVAWDGKDGGGNFVPDGTYTVTASFTDVWGNTGTTPAVAVKVDNTSPAVPPLNNPTPVIAPGTNSTVPTSTTVTDTITDPNLADWALTVRTAGGAVVRTFTGTTAAVAVTWDGKDGTGAIVPDGVYTLTLTARDTAGQTTTVTGSTVVVLTQPPTVTATSNTPTAYGQAVTITATVTEPIPAISNLLGGTTVQFFDGATLLGTGTLALVNGTFRATLTLPTLNAGTHANLHVAYPGTPYFLPSDSGAFTHVVTPVPVVVTADSLTKVYGAAMPPLTFTAVGLVNGDTPATVFTGSLATTATQASPVGTYPITRGTLAANSNYTLTFVGGTLTITPAPLDVTADNLTKVYGAAMPALTFTAVGLTNGDTAATVFTGALATTATQASPVGTYPISQGTLAANANYALTFHPGTLTVTPAPLVVTADNLTKVYGAAVPALTFAVTGLTNGDTAAGVLTGSLFTTATQASPVGTYPITRGTLVANPNYQLAFADGTLTVTPAPLTIAVNNATRIFHTPNPAFTAAFLGLVLGESPAVVQGLNLVTTATIDSLVGQYPIFSSTTPTAANYAITVVPGVLTVTHVRPDAIVNIPADVAVGSGGGTLPQVGVFPPPPRGGSNPTVARLNPAVADDPGFTGGIRVAAADFSGDGVTDVAMGTGPGVPTLVVVLDGKTRQELFRIQPFEPSFTGGVFVAAGDITGDGIPDLVITPDTGGGPRVRIFNGAGFGLMADFLGIEDPNFRGGARAAIGDLNADGFGDLAVAAGFGGGPRVAVFSGQGLSNGQQVKLFPDFFIFGGADAQNLRNGVFLAAGDVNGDGFADLVGGGGPGGGPRVLVVDGKSLVQNGSASPVAVANFFGGDPNNRGGVHVAVKDIDGDKLGDVVIGAGDGAGARVTGYAGAQLVASVTPQAAFAFDVFDNVLNGVFVG